MGAAALPVLGATVGAGILGGLFGNRSASYNAPAGPNMYPEYQRRLLESAYNPNSQLYELAFRQNAGAINREAAKRGLAGSGAALGYQSQSAADLSNKILESETERRRSAYQTAVAPEVQAYQGRLQESQMKYNQEAAEAERYNQMIGNIGSGLGGIAGYGAGQGWFSSTANPSGTFASAFPGVTQYSSTLNPSANYALPGASGMGTGYNLGVSSPRAGMNFIPGHL